MKHLMLVFRLIICSSVILGQRVDQDVSQTSVNHLAATSYNNVVMESGIQPGHFTRTPEELGFNICKDNAKSDKTDWMFRAKVGISTHYSGNRDNVDEMARQFNVEKVAEQLAQVGAGWFLFTLHHQEWTMMAPNSIYDHIIGSSDFTSKRDLPLDLSNALLPKGIKLMLYVNLRLDPRSNCPEEVRDSMGGWPVSDELISNVADVYREFSIRYGNKISGWWVDGAWMSEFKQNQYRENWFETIANALRAGNPNAIVAFNPGLIDYFGIIWYDRLSRYSPQNDYTAGEMQSLDFVPDNRWIQGAQCHLWTYLGDSWNRSGLRFDNDEISDYAKKVTANGGVMTFEVGTRGTPPESNSILGEIDPMQVRQVQFIIESIKKTENLK
jgi:hypothetical protein